MNIMKTLLDGINIIINIIIEIIYLFIIIDIIIIVITWIDIIDYMGMIYY